MKKCGTCEIKKSLDDFHNDRRKKDGKVGDCKKCRSNYKKQHYLKNKKKIDTQNSEYALHNKENKKAQMKGYRKVNKEKISLSSEEYRRNNYGEIQASRRARRHKFIEYRKNNRGKFAAIAAKRRASKIQATPPWFHLEKEAIERLYIEAAKSRKIGTDVHVDHVVPLQSEKVCGLHTLANLDIVDAHKNRVKNNTFKL